MSNFERSCLKICDCSHFFKHLLVFPIQAALRLYCKTSVIHLVRIFVTFRDVSVQDIKI